MPAHTSHLLQPLNVGCFSPLKTLYGLEVAKLAWQSIYHIDKLDFLWIYKKIRTQALSGSNVKAGFQATRLIPFSLERVLSSLTVVRTLSPFFFLKKIDYRQTLLDQQRRQQRPYTPQTSFNTRPDSYVICYVDSLTA
jgi:hypothetical protein